VKHSDGGSLLPLFANRGSVLRLNFKLTYPMGMSP
jgi:hypothetical protein